MVKKGESPALEFFKNSFQEIRKVTWPTKEHTVKSTLIVFAFILGLALIIGIADGIFNFGYGALIDFARNR